MGAEAIDLCFGLREILVRIYKLRFIPVGFGLQECAAVDQTGTYSARSQSGCKGRIRGGGTELVRGMSRADDFYRVKRLFQLIALRLTPGHEPLLLRPIVLGKLRHLLFPSGVLVPPDSFTPLFCQK